MMSNIWLEKELENAIAKDPTILLDASVGERGHDRIHCRLLGQQVPCRTGIIDLLFTYGRQLHIVELKAAKATEATIGQVVRYREAIKYVTEEALYRFATKDQKDRIQYTAINALLDPMCVVVAPSFTKEAINAIATMGWAVVARKDDDGIFHLSPADRFTFDTKSDETIIPLLQSYIEENLACEAVSFRRQKEMGLL